MSKRGFTLVEVSIVVSISSLILATVGSLYLEARTAAVRTESQIALNRQASLATEWMSRDIRSAQSLAAQDSTLTLTSNGERVVWTVKEDGLWRRDSGSARVVAPKVRRLGLNVQGRQVRVQLDLRRRLGVQQSVDVTRIFKRSRR